MSQDKLKYHTILSNYFQSKPLYLDEPTNEKPNIRKLIELPWQQTKGQLLDEVAITLFRFGILQAKVIAKYIYSLIDDCGLVLNSGLSELKIIREKELEEIELLQDIIRLSFNQLNEDPKQLASHLIGRLINVESENLKKLCEKSREETKGIWLSIKKNPFRTLNPSSRRDQIIESPRIYPWAMPPIYYKVSL